MWTNHWDLLPCGCGCYEVLLEYGVGIYEYNKGMSHAKVAAFDGRWMLVGSTDFDIRSMRLNFELNVLVDDPASTAQLEEVLRHDHDQDCERIALDVFRRRPDCQRCLDSLLRPLAPLL